MPIKLSRYKSGFFMFPLKDTLDLLMYGVSKYFVLIIDMYKCNKVENRMKSGQCRRRFF